MINAFTKYTITMMEEFSLVQPDHYSAQSVCRLQYTVDGESYAWKKVHEFHEFNHGRETFPLVHFKFHWNQQCIVGIVKLFQRYAKQSTIRETFPTRNFPRLRQALGEGAYTASDKRPAPSIGVAMRDQEGLCEQRL